MMRSIARRLKLAYVVVVTRLAKGDCCGFPDSKPPWPQG